MKQHLNDIFQDCTPEELDILAENLDETLPSGVLLENIQCLVMQKTDIKPEELDNQEAKPLTRRKKVMLLTAASLAIMAATTLGGFIAVEATEYGDAIRYFDENDISAEGLSRSQIKEIYRDITTVTTDYTTNLITTNPVNYDGSSGRVPAPDESVLQSINRVPGNEISYNNRIENRVGDFISDEETVTNGISYDFGVEYNNDDSRYTYVRKIKDGIQQWEAIVKNVGLDYMENVSSGVIIYGTTPFKENKGEFEVTKPAAAMIDENSGEVLWYTEFEKEAESDYPDAIVENNDGTFTMFSQVTDGEVDWTGEEQDVIHYLVVRTFDKSGKLVEKNKVQTGQYFSLEHISAYGNGFLAEVWTDYSLNHSAIIAQFDKSGEIIKTFQFASENVDYEYISFSEYNGKIYISARERPKESMYSKISITMTPKEILPYMKDEFTAVLLVCDPKSARPSKMYSVKGAFADEINIKNGMLCWNVQRILSAEYMPWSSSTLLFSGYEFLYTYQFNPQGKLVNEEKTGKVDEYFVH